MTKWIEDWFGSEYYCLLYKHRNSDEAKMLLDNLISFLKLSPRSKILDCGCGRGRHSIYLADKGFDVTGIDISEKNVAAAQKSGRDNLTFYNHDIRNLIRTNYYDAALNLFTSFGYFENDYENNKVLKSTSTALKKDGWFVLDFMNCVLEKKELVRNEKSECNGVHFEIKRFVENNFFVKEILARDSGNVSSYSERVKVYDENDLKNFFTQNGLEVIHLLGDYNLNEFNKEKSERLILIGKKK